MIPLSLPSILDELAHQDLVVGLFLLGTGLMFMVVGVRLSRLLVALSFGVIGFVLGGSIQTSDLARLGLGIVIGLGLSTASLVIVRPGVAVLTGLWFSILALIVMDGLKADQRLSLGIALLAFGVAVSLTYVTFNEMIAFVTSLEGTFLFIGGLIVFLNQSPALWHHVRDLLVNSPIFAPFLVLAGTTTGFYLQLAELQKKRVGRSA